MYSFPCKLACAKQLARLAFFSREDLLSISHSQTCFPSTLLHAFSPGWPLQAPAILPCTNLPDSTSAPSFPMRDQTVHQLCPQTINKSSIPSPRQMLFSRASMHLPSCTSKSPAVCHALLKLAGHANISFLSRQAMLPKLLCMLATACLQAPHLLLLCHASCPHDVAMHLHSNIRL